MHELTAAVGQPQNLVSYHLAKLRDAALVSTRRSSADGRDACYTAHLSLVGAFLSQAGAALHAGLDLVPPPATAPRRAGSRTSVLFLCTEQRSVPDGRSAGRGPLGWARQEHP